MNTRETFYVHVHGEQLGPYTIRHIDHLLQSGLIPAETLYWTEGLDQWKPVTDLIPLRKSPRRLRQAAIALVVALPLGVLAWFFGPPLVDGWREQTQRDFTERAAYWAARGVVRGYVGARRMSPAFEPRSEAKVELGENHTATVQIEGVFLSGPRNGERASWTVHLRFDPAAREWTAQPAGPTPQPTPTPTTPP